MASFKEVDIEGVQVKIPQDGFASEETLQALVDAMGGAKRGGGADGPKALGKSTKGAGKDVKAFGKTLFKMNPALTALETGFNLLGSAITGATGLVKSLAQADGSFTGLNSVVDFSTETLTRFTSMIPIVGGFITATAEATAEVTKLRLAFMQIQQEAFQDLAAAGLRLGGEQGLGATLKTVLEANISIDQFGNIVSENTDGLRIFGGTINSATSRFAKDLEALTGMNSETGIGLRLLGLNSTAIAEEFSDFVTANRLNRALMTGTEQQLNNEMLKRAKNERIITELTGKSIKEQRAAQMALATDSAFQAAIADMGPAGAELSTFVAGLPGPIGDAVKQIIAFGTVTDEQSARLIGTIPGLREVLEGNIAGIKSGNVSSSKAVADTIALGQKAIEDGNGLFLAKLAMLDPAFQAVADFIMQGRMSAIQLENVNKLFEDEGKKFEDIGQFQEHVNKEYKDQMETARKLRVKEGEITEKMLKEQGFDDKTVGILLNAMKVEEATGDFQSQLFDTVNNLETLDTVIDGLIDLMQKALAKLKIDDGMNYTVEKANFIIQGVERFENAKTIAEVQSSSSNMGYHSGFYDGNFDPLGGEILNNFSAPNITQEDARKIYEERMNNNNNNNNNAKTENVTTTTLPVASQVNNNTTAPVVDMTETNELLKEQVKQSKKLITTIEENS